MMHKTDQSIGMKELIISLMHFLGLAFWVEIITETPKCTYYFGPFISKKEAEIAKDGYVEDLKSEGAQGIAFKIKRVKPIKLTIFEDLTEHLSKKMEKATLFK